MPRTPSWTDDELLRSIARSTTWTAVARSLGLRASLKMAQCERCDRTEWEGEPIPLELDRINGVHTDNRLQNLRVLCPNCHALTSTYCGRNHGRVVELADTAALGAVASA